MRDFRRKVYIAVLLSFLLEYRVCTNPERDSEKERVDTSTYDLGESLNRSYSLGLSFEQTENGFLPESEKNTTIELGHSRNVYSDTESNNENDMVPTLSSPIGPKTSTPIKSRNTVCQIREDRFSCMSDQSQEETELLVIDSDISSIDDSFDRRSTSLWYTDDNVINIDSSTIKSKRKEIQYRNQKLYGKAMLTVAIAKLRMRRCKRFCSVNVESSYIKNARARFWTKKYKERVEWFIDTYAESSIGQDNIRWFSAEGGKKLCPACFRELYSINKNFYYEQISRCSRGARTTGIRKERKQSEKIVDAGDWLKNYAMCHGDRMPEKNVVLLPYKTRKIDIYRHYEEEQILSQHQPVSRSAFYAIWDKKFSNLKIKQTNSFSKCNTCTNLQAQAAAHRIPGKRSEIEKLIRVHNSRQRMERWYYKDKRDKAKSDKFQYLSLIIDGMDQSKTNLPHFTGRRSNELDISNLLSTHVQGVINHGLERFSKYIDVKEYPHDSNMVINTLLKEIYESSKEYGNKLPPVLFLQADNCYRENKNRYVLAFCELLIRKDIFKEVHLSFLFVGHTHEDVDAGFSKISDILRRNDAETLPRLLHIIPNMKQLRGIYDIRNWLKPALNTFMHHTKPHHFKFSTNSFGNTIVQYKGTQNKAWIDLQGTFLKQSPTGVPNIIQPNFDKIDLDGLRKNIDRCKYLFTDESQQRWWNLYIENLAILKTDVSAREIYSKVQAKWILPLLPTQSETPIHVERQTVVDEGLREMVDQELDDPEVVVRTQRNRQQENKQTTKTTRKMSVIRKRSGNRKGPKSRRRMFQKVFVSVPFTNDIKKHIWLMIFIDLLETFIYMLLFMFVIVFYLGFFCLDLILRYLKQLFMILFVSHIGGNAVCHYSSVHFLYVMPCSLVC